MITLLHAAIMKNLAISPLLSLLTLFDRTNIAYDTIVMETIGRVRVNDQQHQIA